MAHRLKQLSQELRKDERIKKITSLLPPLHFITVHYTYFILTCMIFSVIFWGSSDPGKSVSYTDSLFLVVSAMTEAGLNTVNLSQLTTFQQILLWILIIIGSSIFVSISTVLTRKRVFESRFRDMVKLQKEARRIRKRSMSVIEVKDAAVKPQLVEASKPSGTPIDRSDLDSRNGGPKVSSPKDLVASPKKPLVPKLEVNAENLQTNAVIGESVSNDGEQSPGGGADHISFLRYAPSPSLKERRVLNFAGVGAHPNATGYKSPYSEGIYNRTNRKDLEEIDDGENLHHWQYPTYLTRHTTGRNGQFFGLSKTQREHLGGVEYRAITLLAWIVSIYFVLWQLLGCLALGAYLAHHYASTARENGINPWYVL